jgi:hypothetical protein
MHDSEDLGSNPTDNPALTDLAAVGRRTLLAGGLATAAVAFAATGGRSFGAASTSGLALLDKPNGTSRPLLGFPRCRSARPMRS